MKQLSFFLMTLTSSFAAVAHEGHGLLGSAHWHATDSLGFIALLVLAGALWYFGTRK